MSSKIFPIYTKTFGGKIEKHLHSVSPDNSLTNILMVSPCNFSRHAKINIYHAEHKLTKNFDSSHLLEFFKKDFESSEYCLCSGWYTLIPWRYLVKYSTVKRRAAWELFTEREEQVKISTMQRFNRKNRRWKHFWNEIIKDYIAGWLAPQLYKPS